MTRLPCVPRSRVCSSFWAEGAEFPLDSQKGLNFRGSRNPALGAAPSPLSWAPFSEPACYQSSLSTRGHGQGRPGEVLGRGVNGAPRRAWF